jgi:Nucleotidyl transferase AbiEii toxin, Type IV TA system
MAREVKNTAAAVRAGLLDLARKTERDFQSVVTTYALERLLYRLSVSRHKDRYILRGGLLLAVWLDDPLRGAGGLELLARDSADAAAIAKDFREIVSQPVDADGLTFDAPGLRTVTIGEGTRYAGVRVEAAATLERACVFLRIDIGHGDAVVPRAAEIDYPTLLKSPAPRLRAYRRETVVAETLEAIASLGQANSRMTEFHDLCLLARRFDFDGQMLARAIHTTFRRRQTVLPTGLPEGLTDAFAGRRDVQARWRTLRTAGRLASDIVDFADCVCEIRRFVGPLLEAMSEPHIALRHWPAGGPWQQPKAALLVRPPAEPPRLGRPRPVG